MEQAKIDRTSAKRQMTIAIKSMKSAIDDKRDTKLIEERFETVKTKWDSLSEKHSTYLAHAYPDDSSEPATEEEWLDTCFASYSDAEKQFEAFMKQDKKHEISNPAKKTKKLKGALKFEGVLTMAGESDGMQGIITEAREQMKKQLDIYHEKQRQYVELLSDDDEIDAQSQMMSKMQDLYIEANLAAGKATKNQSTKSKEHSSTIKMKFQNLKMPSFNGEIRDYPCFKKDFQSQVMPCTDTNAAAYTLKQCLLDEPLSIVRNIDEDIDEMWRRLDERYGRRSKLTDAIMFDIKKLRNIADGDNKQFLDLVNTIEKAHHDLNRVNMEMEISNSTIVSLIEEKLPPNIKVMWCLEVSDKNSQVEDTNKFPSLLEFLKKHRRAIEYGSNDLRTKKCAHINLQTGTQHHLKEETPTEASASSIDKTNERKPGCWIHATNRHDILECCVYLEEQPRERWDLVTDYRACWGCLRTGHRQNQCYTRRECGIDNCKGTHHPSLHESKRPSQQGTAIKQKHFTDQQNNALNKRSCMLQLMGIPAGIKTVTNLNVLWDSGAQVSMITFNKAKAMELSGIKTQITIVKIGGEKETVDTRIYDVPIHDTNGNTEVFKAYGINKISSMIEPFDTESLAPLFHVEANQVKRPNGEIDMLIGFEYAGFHPEKEQSVDHLLLMSNKFGKCIGGTHSTIMEKTQLLLQEVQIAHVAVKIEDFYNTEALGVSCNPRCGGCKCNECPIGGKQYTLREERELAMIEQGLSFENGRWIAHYPWKKSANDLPNNYNAAFAMLRSTEKRLCKDKHLAKLYDDQIHDMINRGVAKRLSEKEARQYKGPVYYISHHEVIKPESTSTPCRIVFNSSAQFLNQNLNDYWVKGPNLMNNLLGVLLRFRENKVAVAGDISKMYHAVGISIQDQHVHRFLWRGMRTEYKPDIYLITAVPFGDKPAGAIAALALRKTAEMNGQEYPDASEMITKNTYVDDILGSLNDKEEAQEMTSNIDKVIKRGGFKIKKWVISNETELNSTNRIVGSIPSSDKNEEPASKVLGVVWNSQNDTLQFVTKINFSPKKRNIHTEPCIQEENILDEVPQILTRRMILSQVNGIYDPLGLATPFVVQAKILLRNLTEEQFQWDDPIPETERAKWIKFFADMFRMERISFHRSTKPTNANGKPSLVIFSDASENAFGCCAYVRWKKSDAAESRLLMAKSRLAPMKRITIPRLELNAALMAARMKDFIVKETKFDYEAIYMIVDSEIVRAMIQKESYGFRTFVGVRVGEIQSLTNKNDWYWIEGSLNIADIISRGTHPEELDITSQWQTGPTFLNDNEENWPLKQNYSGNELPDQVIVAIQQTQQLLPRISEIIDINRFSSYDNLMRVTARVISAFKGNPKISLSNISQIPSRDQIKEAERLWIIDAQYDIQNTIKPEVQNRLGIKEKDGVMFTGCRLEDWSNHTYDNTNPILLSSKSKLSELYANKIHNLCHLGVSTVISKIQRKYWIVGARNFVKKIKHKCVTCRKLNKTMQKQVMGKIPTERLNPAPAWSYSSLDLFGPFEIRGETNKRSKAKGYGVIFNCLLSRAVHLEIVSDYSTDSFLLAIRRFIALRGCTIKMWSDRGSQLVAANKEMKQVITDHDEKLILEFSSDNSIDWSFTTPDAPWQNGCAESLVKSAKRAIIVAIGSQTLTFTEMQTVLYEVANLLNERPIGRHPTAVEDGAYLCPNDLLLGRSTSKISGGPFSNATNKYIRYKFVQKIVSAFWTKWTRDFFPSLTVWQKWHTAHRNVKVGDVVLIQDSNQIRGKWKMGRVTQANSSLRDGFVRNIEVQYKNEGSNSFTKINRPVQRVIVIVPVDEDNE